ncbi:uncharacterized protein F5147DRAFT_660477 [Suillus discolor]|uniref:Uncharacterized protein n=1 Tax=Suillus discolor TaxID=1912936 RepID=A0A9P7ER21_9AGAM|nr:uncharacterized protein F5147DRAFT_660477 [Suillus discolor]KAG2082500.1 hypothetical protein F5147DRAFT_660477 [Suillus discolor]
MTTSIEEETIRIALKDSDYGRILKTIENNAFSETAILTPMYSQVIDDILGEQDARLGAGTSLAVCIIRTTKLLEDVANRDDLDEGTKKLAVLHLQKRIRVLALHLLPLDFPDIANQAVRTVEARPHVEERSRPIVPVPRSASVAEDIGHTFRKCPDYVCCVCDELGPDHLSVHCPQLNGRIVLQEFRDEEKFFEALLDWEHNHKALADLTLRHPAPPSPEPETPPVPAVSTPTTPPAMEADDEHRILKVGDFDASRGVMLQ